MTENSETPSHSDFERPVAENPFAVEKMLNGLRRLVRDATDDDRTFVPGLEAVYVAESSISTHTDLPLYCGYPVDHLASAATFPEVAWLLMRGDLPDAEHYADFRSLMSEVTIDPALLDWCDAVPMHVEMVDYLRSAVSLLAHFDPHPDNRSLDGMCIRLATLLVSLPQLTARRFHALRGNELAPTDCLMSYASNTLTQFNGRNPTALQERAFEALLVVLADPEFDASTLAARVSGGAMADLYTCVSSALSAFNGRRHKPHNLHYLRKLLSAATADESERLLRLLMSQDRTVGGFIVDCENTPDPRVDLLRELP